MNLTSRPSLRSAIIGTVVVACACLLGWRAVKSTYLDKKHDLQKQILDAQEKVASFRQDVDERLPIKRELRSYAERTLGTSGEEVIDILRSRLSRIGETAGLQNLSVSSSGIRKIASPADSEFPRPLRGQADFYELSGELSGRGTYQQALCVVELIEAEPYLHQVRRVSLRPRQNGSEIDVSITMATIFFSEREVEGAASNVFDSQPATVDAAVVAKRLGTRNVFQVPPPPPPPPPEPEPEPVKEVKPPPPPPPPPPYQDWMVTAVVSIDGAPELWLRNVKDNKTRHLAVGQRILGAQFVSGEGNRAVINVDGEPFAIEVGWTLNKRQKIADQ
ncbi:MAG: hypothetical protein HND57_08760 [Planctomycetes bacterium]|nr:hypothetical protein [Planctomycetota bacterium]